MNQTVSQPQGRLLALDRLKGLCIFLMLFLESIGFFRVFGPLYRIAADRRLERVEIIPGLEWGDCMLPMFLFLIGMSCYYSFTRRAAVNKKDAVRHFAVRYLIFAALGSCMVSIEYLMNGKLDYIRGTQAICVVCLLAGIANFTMKGLKKKMKHGETISRWCVLVFYTACVTLILLDLPVNLVDMWRQFFYPGTTQDFYDQAYMHWSILHVFAYAGMISLIFIAMNVRARIASMIGLAALRLGLQCIPLFEERRSALVLGGPWAVAGWVLCIAGGYTLCEAYVRAKRPWLLCTVTFVVTASVGTVLTILLPISSRGVSVNFLFLMAALFTFLFWTVACFDRVNVPFDVLALWGRSPIFIFCIGLLLKVILLVWLPYDEPLWVALAFMTVSAGILAAVTVWLKRSKHAIHI